MSVCFLICCLSPFCFSCIHRKPEAAGHSVRLCRTADLCLHGFFHGHDQYFVFHLSASVNSCRWGPVYSSNQHLNMHICPLLRERWHILKLKRQQTLISQENKENRSNRFMGRRIWFGSEFPNTEKFISSWQCVIKLSVNCPNEVFLINIIHVCKFRSDATHNVALNINAMRWTSEKLVMMLLNISHIHPGLTLFCHVLPNNNAVL